MLRNGYYMVSDIALGTRVQITHQSKYKTFDLIGKLGVVRSNYGSNLAIEVDGIRNPASGPGYFYLRERDFTLVDDEHIDDSMEENDMPKITNYLNAVRVTLAGNATPCNNLYANFDAILDVGDTCVVKRPNHQLTVGTVVEIVYQEGLGLDSEVVGRVDMYDYNKRVAAREKAAELKAKMQERAKQLQDIALYQMLAKDDPAMQALLDEYQALNKN